jgi:hypothetical protein
LKGCQRSPKLFPFLQVPAVTQLSGTPQTGTSHLYVEHIIEQMKTYDEIQKVQESVSTDLWQMSYTPMETPIGSHATIIRETAST